MKSILLSARPEWIAKIFNGDKTAEIRRTAPKEWVDYLSGETIEKPKPMTVYIYCTKSGILVDWGDADEDIGRYMDFTECPPLDRPQLQGKVVASFVLKEVEKVHYDGWSDHFYTERDDFRTDVLSASDLAYEELKDRYFKNEFKMGCYAWHISDLTIFDEPKELSEFFHGFKLKNNGTILFDYDYEALRQSTLFGYEYSYPLKKAPSSWCYVEVRE